MIYTARFPFALTASLLLAALATCWLATDTLADEGLGSEPYSVFVAYEEAHARCGPATEYYRTDPLRHGQELQVYVQTEDGWLGVRPPENSFCWLPATAVKTSNRGQAGVVIEDRSVAWIGTHLGRAKRYRWQVQLAEGEPVTIIGRSERDGPDGPQLWYRIVPPSGEFRWVHRNQVARTAEELLAISTRAPANPVRNVSAADSPTVHRPRSTTRSATGEVQQALGSSALGNSVLQAEGSSHNERRAPKVASVRPANSASSNTQASSRRTYDRLQPVGSTQPVLSQAPRSREAMIREARERDLLSHDDLPSRDHLDRDLAGPAEAAPLSRQEYAPVAVADVQPAPRLRPHSASAVRPAGAARKPSESATAQAGAIGSGVSEQWKTNPVRESVESTASQPAPQQVSVAQPTYQVPVDGSAEFVSRPRLIDIGTRGAAATPTSQERPTDSNWIVASSRNSMPNAYPGPQSGNSIVSVGGGSANSVQSVGYNGASHAAGPTVKTASAEQIAAITNEARDADVERLHLMLSRLMASSATAAETQPIADAAERLTRSSASDLTVARARLLNERVAQYQRIAVRRDGNVSVASNVVQASLSEPTVQGQSASQDSTTQGFATQGFATRASAGSAGQTLPLPVVPAASAMPAATGYLVQVYSARASSPPYALTDRVGNTIAYVTPAPGVNLRPHLNNEISVTGQQGYVQGLNTPHIMASQASRNTGRY